MSWIIGIAAIGLFTSIVGAKFGYWTPLFVRTRGVEGQPRVHAMWDERTIGGEEGGWRAVRFPSPEGRWLMERIPELRALLDVAVRAGDGLRFSILRGHMSCSVVRCAREEIDEVLDAFARLAAALGARPRPQAEDVTLDSVSSGGSSVALPSD